MSSTRPRGDIVTLLDLTPRDVQDNELTPLAVEKTFWLPDADRRNHPFSIGVQQFPLRGPAGFGQTFSFDVGSIGCGDLLFSTVLQVNLGHWFDDTTLLRLQGNRYEYPSNSNPWYYANSLGTVILEKAELEVNGDTLETLDGDFLNVTSLLYQDVNNQFGFSVDGLGRIPFTKLGTTPSYKPFPTQNGQLFIPLPFFYQRIRLAEGFPILACKEGSVRINITFRPFSECVRRLNGIRSSCDEVPLNTSLPIVNKTEEVQFTINVNTSIAVPQFKNIQLITYGAHTDGMIRQSLLRKPFENLIRNVQTFYFSEPLKYQVNKSSNDTIQVQLPLEVNDPMEEILWFVRRKDVANNNEWTNYSNVLQSEYNELYNPRQPLLQAATIQLDGIELISEEEQWFRQHISLLHKGGYAAYNNFIYGYSFSKFPGQHQPSGTANASRLQNIRLTLDVKGGEGLWEVKVFVVTLKWLRFQNGIANFIFSD